MLSYYEHLLLFPIELMCKLIGIALMYVCISIYINGKKMKPDANIFTCALSKSREYLRTINCFTILKENYLY